MRKLNADTKSQIRDYIRRELESPSTDTEAKVHLLHYWVCGLLENADEHEKIFFETPSDGSNPRGVEPHDETHRLFPTGSGRYAFDC
jgi:hypothetical protein